MIRTSKRTASQIRPEDRAALIDQIVAEGEALRARNRELSSELVRRLAGIASTIELGEQPDGLGMFYGAYVADGGVRHRLDVMPPRHLWTGDAGEQHADAMCWIVYLDGEEVERAPSVAELSTLASALARRVRV